ncbi:MAG: hypothetical protein EU547_03150, partial [Promethearchaeota archaeon]
MIDKKTESKLININVGFILVVLTLIAILAWITYGTLGGVLGMLAYILIGTLNLYPWVIPIVGIIIGILILFGILPPDMYQSTLSLAHLSPSWMSITWYWIISIIGIFIGLLATIMILSWLKDLLHKKKEPKANYALVNCTIIDGKKNSAPIQNGVILIKNIVQDEDKESPGKITAVGTKHEINIP